MNTHEYIKMKAIGGRQKFLLPIAKCLLPLKISVYSCLFVVLSCVNG